MKAEWLESLKASLSKHQHIPSAVFAQLATIDLQNRPANRTVVFRTFVNESLVFTTRKDSEKINHLQHNPFAELCWYFTDTREQYRLMGKCKVIDSLDIKMQDTRENIWQSLSEASKQMFSWQASGKPVDELEAYHYLVPQQVSEQFVLVVLEPIKVDIVDLRPVLHQRQVYTLTDSAWIIKRVNP